MESDRIAGVTRQNGRKGITRRWNSVRQLRRAALQAVLPLVPDKITLPVVTGPARGMRWRRDACNACFWLGTYERAKCEAFVRELKPNDVFYDIGANSG